MTDLTRAHSRILIIGPSWVGDMVMAQSLFILLEQQYPDCQIDVMAPQWSGALLERMPQISEFIPMPLGHGTLQLKMRYQLGRSLQKKAYDQCILLPNSLKSALIPFWAKIPQRTGYTGEMRYGLLNDMRKLDQTLLTMTVQRFAVLAYPKAEMYQPQYRQLEHIPVPKLLVKAEPVDKALEQFGLNKTQPVLSLCPGAEYGPAKQWPARHYAKLALEKIVQGWQVWIFGSQKDQDIGNEILGLINDPLAVSLCGKTELAQAIDLLSVSRMVVSNDSGLMHLAAALGVPVLGVYGSSDPDFTPPLGINGKTISLNLHCSPCFKRICPLGHTDCLEKLQPEQVLSTLEQLTQQNSSQAGVS